MFLANKLNKGGNLSSPDGQFNYVTMLLHGDGTNGAQNNTFLDSSTNNFTITRNGNTTQGSFSPYGSNWSNFFNGADDYLTCSVSVPATGAFTVEMFVFPTSTAGYQLLFSQFTSGNAGSLQILWDDTTDKFTVNIGTGTVLTSSSTYALNTWHHLAITRNGSNNMTMWVNGASAATATNSTSILQTTTFIGTRSVALDGKFNGYISNLRVTNTAVYTGSFTPSTTPLTAISGTTLLTCQSARFIDNSTNNFTITVNGLSNEGHPIALKFNPFGASSAYSTGVVGGSGYFDGTGDYLSTTVTAKSAGTASFTYELWFYEQATDGLDRHLFTTRTSDANTGFDCRVNASGVINLQRGGSTDFFTSTAIANVACWNHLAIVRNGASSLTIYLNGVSIGTASLNYNFTVTDYKIGVNYATDDAWKGYITDFRYTKAAVYTANFTPNTAPLAAITDTALLLNFTNGAIIDNAMMNNLETVGNAQISTSVKKYGTGSLAFDGTGDYLFGGNYLSATFGTGDFTIEMWLYYSSSAAGSDFLIDCRPAATNGAYPTIYADTGILYYYANSGNRITSSSISTDTWMHVAVCRSGTSTKMFINGTQTGSTYTDSTNYICRTDGPVIGADRNFGDSLLGYIDDFRITKGYARYTATFTPPTSALSDTGPY